MAPLSQMRDRPNAGAIPNTLPVSKQMLNLSLLGTLKVHSLFQNEQFYRKNVFIDDAIWHTAKIGCIIPFLTVD
jgi:hypothetical protein